MLGFNQNPIESIDVCKAFAPVNMATAANNGVWVDARGWEGILVLLFKAAGTAGDDPTITVRQASSSSGTGAKALPFRDTYYKMAASLTSQGWTVAEQSGTSRHQFTRGDLAEAQALVGIWVPTETMDNGFDWLQASVADVGSNAQLGAMLYFGFGPRYGGVNVNRRL